MATPPPSTSHTADAAPQPSTTKPIHSLVLDTGPLIKNDPPVSVLISKAEKLYILPNVVSEIRDAATRSRIETTLLPFTTLRSPKPDSIKFITGFARKTGDLAVLSRPDIEVLALGYELECERNNGDWRLRNTPGQKRLNGRPAQGEEAAQTQPEASEKTDAAEGQNGTEETKESTEESANAESAPAAETVVPETTEPSSSLDTKLENLTLDNQETAKTEAVSSQEPQVDASAPVDEVPLKDGEKADETVALEEAAEDKPEIVEEEDDDDEDGWITPSNLKKHQAKDANTSTPTQPAAQKTLQAAVLTSDYAMQNVALRMNLNLVAPSMARITQLKTWVLRCHGCFTVTRDMARQFCPSCGQPTLLRTSCSTDDKGTFRLHLKRNFQWNNRGNVYSVPKPVHGSAHGRLHRNAPGNAGGKNGWGKDLILAEDQKEFVRAGDEQRRARQKDLMDEDYLPSILTGDRAGSGGRIRVGAGRNVNSRKKR
jgi:RNA-binding protein NOB1